jgi:uncharacterized membrane protein YdjX (TVP38/TMEM64 family)
VHPTTGRRLIKVLAFVGGLLAIAAVGEAFGVRALLDPDTLRERTPELTPKLVAFYLFFCVIVGGASGACTLVGTLLFGWKGGTLMAVLGCTMAGSLHYWMARSFLREVVEAWMGDRTRTVLHLLRARGLGFVIAWRLFLAPLFPLTVAAGLARFPFPRFAMSSVAMVPGTVLFSLGIDSVFRFGWENIPDERWLTLICLLVVELTLYLLALRRWPVLRPSFR